MRGIRCTARLLLCCATALNAGLAAAKDPPPRPTPKSATKPSPEPDLSPTIFVIDGSKSMNEKIDKAIKIDSAGSIVGQAVSDYTGQFAFGLVAFGHRKSSNCADSEILAKPGELTTDTEERLLGGIKAKGQAPVAAALSDAATASSGADDKLDIVLVADGSDSCDVDLCVTADALKQKAKGLRIHVIGFNAKPEQLEPLSCVATATGGKFVAATNNSELEQGLAVVLGAIATSMPAQVVTVPMPDWDQGAPADDSPPPSPSPELTEPGESSIGKSAGAGPAAVGQQNGETAINKSDAPPLSKPQALAQRAPTSPAAASQPQDPVPVTFKALVTEAGPKLQSGLTWRVYASKAEADGHYELISTHRESTPTAALLPGEYLVNAAYGLSNLTKKVKVESGQSIEETFILNTGGLKLTAVLADGQPLPEGNVHFNVLSDEQDQFGNRRTILADAKPGMVVRLNAGAYHVVSLYGDANANVGVDVTVEPGRITEATIKHTGAKITFKLVQTLGGEALADTKWKILTSAGDEVKSNVGALPTHILAAGSYVVVADHGGLNYTRKFSIEPGQPKQIEVAIEDGPTSPEALKALLEPPEPPTSGAGTYAGDGGPESGMGFDGFSSAPADPNAPLINPGALFRPSR